MLRRQVKWLGLHTPKANSICLVMFTLYFNHLWGKLPHCSHPLCQIRPDLKLASFAKIKMTVVPQHYLELTRRQAAGNHYTFQKNIYTLLTFNSVAPRLCFLSIVANLSLVFRSSLCVCLCLRVSASNMETHFCACHLYVDAQGSQHLDHLKRQKKKKKSFGAHILYT